MFHPRWDLQKSGLMQVGDECSQVQQDTILVPCHGMDVGVRGAQSHPHGHSDALKAILLPGKATPTEYRVSP